MHPSKVRGNILDRLCDDQIFYVEKSRRGCLVVEGMNSAYFTTLTPLELVELGTDWSSPGSGLKQVMHETFPLWLGLMALCLILSWAS